VTLANLLTCSRAVLAAFVAAFLFSKNPFGKILALFIFITAALTDYWDGWLARQMGQESQLGKLLDPIADKALTLSAFVSFWRLELVPFWMVAVVVCRDLVVTGSRFLVPPNNRGARSSGKHKTALQILYIIAVLCYLVARELPQWQGNWNGRALAVVDAGMGLIVLVTVITGMRVLLKNVSTTVGQKA
jgi:CDP-diacylglycerol--glycerol-3-phosphate 3-phosphatidyltransferase